MMGRPRSKERIAARKTGSLSRHSAAILETTDCARATVCSTRKWTAPTKRKLKSGAVMKSYQPLLHIRTSVAIQETVTWTWGFLCLSSSIKRRFHPLAPPSDLAICSYARSIAPADATASRFFQAARLSCRAVSHIALSVRRSRRLKPHIRSVPTHTQTARHDDANGARNFNLGRNIYPLTSIFTATRGCKRIIKWIRVETHH